MSGPKASLTPLLGRSPDHGLGDEGKDKVGHNVPPHLAASTRSHCNFIKIISNYNNHISDYHPKDT